MLGINNENCFDTIRKVREKNRKVGLILTSPPYNTGRNSNSERGRNNLNKATFSSELVLKLLDIYYTGGVVYDPFMGTGSTGVACEMLGIKWLGSEISTAQCNYARNRIEEVKNGSSSN